jgi:murein DD-endopeptidase MepM/ murein hydrolase activator NlpD
MTGYATGPHLHFTVFATQGVQIQDIRSRVCGRMMTLPVGALNSYLNPLDYL